MWAEGKECGTMRRHEPACGLGWLEDHESAWSFVFKGAPLLKAILCQPFRNLNASGLRSRLATGEGALCCGAGHGGQTLIIVATCQLPQILEKLRTVLVLTLQR